LFEAMSIYQRGNLSGGLVQDLTLIPKSRGVKSEYKSEFFDIESKSDVFKSESFPQVRTL
jgi:hypothetical protein